ASTIWRACQDIQKNIAARIAAIPTVMPAIQAVWARGEMAFPPHGMSQRAGYLNIPSIYGWLRYPPPFGSRRLRRSPPSGVRGWEGWLPPYYEGGACRALPETLVGGLRNSPRAAALG